MREACQMVATAKRIMTTAHLFPDPYFLRFSSRWRLSEISAEA